MDFKTALSNFFASSLIVFRRFFNLIFVPYKAMRKISLEEDYKQPFIIFFVIFLYFQIANKIRAYTISPILTFLVFLLNFFLMTLFFYFLGKVLNRETRYKNLFFTFSYGLLPTLTWFITSSLFYFLLPPPRTTSILGTGFSIFFITFSLSLLFWKLLLSYLALRFSLKLSFYKIIYVVLLFLSWFVPYSILLYYLRIFRVPFI